MTIYRCGCGHLIDPDEEHPYGDPRGHVVIGPDPETGEPAQLPCGPGTPVDGSEDLHLHCGRDYLRLLADLRDGIRDIEGAA